MDYWASIELQTACVQVIAASFILVLIVGLAIEKIKNGARHG